MLVFDHYAHRAPSRARPDADAALPSLPAGGEPAARLSRKCSWQQRQNPSAPGPDAFTSPLSTLGFVPREQRVRSASGPPSKTGHFYLARKRTFNLTLTPNVLLRPSYSYLIPADSPLPQNWDDTVSFASIVIAASPCDPTSEGPVPRVAERLSGGCRNGPR